MSFQGAKYLPEGRVAFGKRIENGENEIDRQMIDFMQPLALPKKTCCQFFNDDVQENAGLISFCPLVWVLTDPVVIDQEGNYVESNDRFQMGIMDLKVTIEFSNWEDSAMLEGMQKLISMDLQDCSQPHSQRSFLITSE